jgi:polysaccharide export outer membrane protein
VALVLVACLTGCSTSPGNRLTLFPERHELIPAARELRAVASEPQPLPRELDKHVLPPYLVEPGDTLLVQPADIDSTVRLPGDQTVLLDGTIHLGKYGQMIVAGKTVEEIETQIRATIIAQTPVPKNPPPPDAPDDRPNDPRDPGKIVVRIVSRQSKVYYVLGEVNAPGEFVLNGRETVLDGIVTAGGLNDRASRKQIILSRPTPPDGCRKVLPVCYPEIVQLGDTSTNYQLAPGDRIYVPSRGLFEDLFAKKYDCPPCNRPQTSCYAGAGCGGAGPAAPPVPPVHWGTLPGIQVGEPLPAPRRDEETR